MKKLTLALAAAGLLSLATLIPAATAPAAAAQTTYTCQYRGDRVTGLNPGQASRYERAGYRCREER